MTSTDLPDNSEKVTWMIQQKVDRMPIEAPKGWRWMEDCDTEDAVFEAKAWFDEAVPEMTHRVVKRTEVVTFEEVTR